MTLQKCAAVLCAVCVFFLILTASIGLPIYIRPFYYAHIEALGLPEATGFTAEQIRAAYDAVLDYLTLPGREFGTGVLAHSAAGKAHFEDCKALFDLNAGIFLASALLLLGLYALGRAGKLRPLRLGRHHPALYGAAACVVIPVVVGGLAALDFNRAFTVFHLIFFPGKDNWLFDPRTDEIIRVLPQVFFRNCAIFIGAGLLAFSAAAALWALGRGISGKAGKK